MWPQFDLATFLTATYSALLGGAIGAAVTLVVGWSMTSDVREQIAYIANFLEWSQDEGKGPEFLRDEAGHVEGTKGHGQAVAGASINVGPPRGEEGESTGRRDEGRAEET